MPNYFTEDQPWGATLYEVVPGSRTSFQTEQAKIDIITNPHFGRMLFIDGVLQSATADEHIYHNALVSEGVNRYNAAEGRPCREVLIMGGAEGATLRTLQDLDAAHGLGVEKMVMVDWDKQLVEHMRENEPWSRGSFDDERVQVYYEDIWDYLETTPTLFDTVLVDLLDPKTLFERDWLFDLVRRTLHNHVKEDGTVLVNIGNATYEAWFWDKIREEFPYCSKIIKQIQVPSFQEPWFLIAIFKHAREPAPAATHSA